MPTLPGWSKSKSSPCDPDSIADNTGAYHRELETALAKQSVAYAKVNPQQARRFGEPTSRLAKTDRIDAAMLARMGAVLELEAQTPKVETMQCLKDLNRFAEKIVSRGVV